MMARANHTVLVLLAICLGVLGTFGVPFAMGQAAAVEQAEPVETTVGNGLVMSLPEAVDRVALVDESVARVTILSQKELMLHGLTVGRTALFVWLEGGSRKKHMVNVRRDLDLLGTALADLDPGIKVQESADGKSILLLGDVKSSAVADGAGLRATGILGGAGKEKPALLNLLRYPRETAPLTADARLAEALKEIDPRITIRRIRVGDVDAAKEDSYVLEGKVESISDLLRAVTVAERQLGEQGGKVEAPDDERRVASRRSGLNGLSGGASGGGNNALQALQGADMPKAGLASQVSRGLVVASESGKVISFLEVDQIHQILVSIRVLEIDRGKARDMGINYRVDGRHLSIGNYTGPQGSPFEDPAVDIPTIAGIADGNLVGAYVSQTVRILGAIDFLEGKSVARSVAEPNVLTLTGEEASVIVGGEVPIPTTHVGEITALQSYFFQSFGVRLDIRPTVDKDEVITLEVAPSIVRPDNGLSVDEVPGFQVQSVQTTARVKAAQSLVLGGLLSYSDEVVVRKLPILGDIPVLNALFKWESKSRSERELLFVITPRLMPEAQPELEELAQLPPPESREAGLNDEVVPQELTDQGVATSWVEAAEQRADDKRLAEEAAAEAVRLEAERKAAEEAAAAAAKAEAERKAAEKAAREAEKKAAKEAKEAARQAEKEAREAAKAEKEAEAAAEKEAEARKPAEDVLPKEPELPKAPAKTSLFPSRAAPHEFLANLEEQLELGEWTAVPDLGKRVESIISEWHDVSSEDALGGKFYLNRDRVFCAAFKGLLLIRLAEEEMQRAEQKSLVKPFHVMGWPVQGWAVVGEKGADSDTELESWLTKALASAST